MNSTGRKTHLSLAVLLAICFQGKCFAADEMQLGLDAYKQQNFAEAIKHLDIELQAKPSARAAYFLAVANVHLGKSARAQKLFEYIVSAYPGSAEAGLAKTALAKLKPETASSPSTPPPADGAPAKTFGDTLAIDGKYKDKRIVQSQSAYEKELAAIPSQVRIPITSGGVGGATAIIGSINNQNFYFRNNQKWETYVSVEDLQRARIEVPKGPTNGKENEKPVWKIALDITIGGIKRKVPVSVFKEHAGYPELGTAFFEGFAVDSSGGTMVLRKKTIASAKSPHSAIEDYQKEYAKLPDTAEIRFRPGEQGHMLVDAQVNGRSMQCWFDTGANAFFGLNNLRQAGLPLPTGDPDTATRGWAGKTVSAWTMTIPVKLGSMTRMIPALVSSEWEKPPLLGQEFLRDYQYSIDSAGGRMLLTKKHVQSAKPLAPAHSLYDVKCDVNNDREYVTLMVNGQRCHGVLIDTGAAFTIISKPMADSLGIVIPKGAPYYQGSGVGGEFTLREVECDLRLGPVFKQGFPVRIGGEAGCAIGQDFMSGWRFSVDREQKLLRFFH